MGQYKLGLRGKRAIERNGKALVQSCETGPEWAAWAEAEAQQVMRSQCLVKEARRLIK